jgi:hypothetical protein
MDYRGPEGPAALKERLLSGISNNPNPSQIPIKVLIARTVAYRGKVESYGSLSAMFQGVCALLRDAGTLPGVYGVLAQVKQRILNAGQPLTVDDVADLAAAHNARAGKADPLVIGEPRFILSLRGSGERMAFHREFVHNLRITQRPLLTLDEETLVEVLANLFQPRHYSEADRSTLLALGFAQQEGLGVLRILDTIYKATFSRTIRKDLCDHKVVFPLPEGSFQLRLDQERTAHLAMPCFELLRHLLFRLFRTPDLATVLDSDDRARTRIQDGLRLLTGALHDAAVLPQKRQEVEAFFKDRKPADGEDLEEL